MPAMDSPSVTQIDATGNDRRLLPVPEIWADFTGKTGDFPTSADSGQQWDWPVGAPSPYPPVISGGRYTNAATTGAAATYLEAELSDDVARIGFDVSFGAGSGSGISAVLIVGATSVTDDYPTTPAFPVHVGITLTHTLIGYYDETAITLRAVRHLAPLAQDGTTYRLEVSIDGDTLTVVSPDGQVVQASHPFIAANPGRFAVWEVFQTDAATGAKPKIARLWAESRNSEAPTSRGMASGALLATSARGGISSVATFEKDPGGWVTVTGAWTDVDTAGLQVYAPPPGPTGRVLITYCAPYLTEAACGLLWGLSDTAVMYGITKAVNSAHDGMVVAQIAATIPEGALVYWQHLRSGAGAAYATLDKSAGGNATLTLTPI